MLISIGEDTNSQEKLKKDELEFEVGLRKLLQISTSDLDVESVDKIHKELVPIPRENLNALQQLGPLWESMQTRITILEERSSLAPEFNMAKKDMKDQKEILYSDIDRTLQDWSAVISNHGSEEQSIIQIILVVDIIVFFLVLSN